MTISEVDQECNPLRIEFGSDFPISRKKRENVRSPRIYRHFQGDPMPNSDNMGQQSIPPKLPGNHLCPLALPAPKSSPLGHDMTTIAPIAGRTWDLPSAWTCFAGSVNMCRPCTMPGNRASARIASDRSRLNYAYSSACICQISKKAPRLRCDPSPAKSEKRGNEKPLTLHRLAGSKSDSSAGQRDGNGMGRPHSVRQGQGEH
jgi:hypothetical protein